MFHFIYLPKPTETAIKKCLTLANYRSPIVALVAAIKVAFMATLSRIAAVGDYSKSFYMNSFLIHPFIFLPIFLST